MVFARSAPRRSNGRRKRMKPLQGCLEAAFIRENCGWKGWGDVMVERVENRMVVDSEWPNLQKRMVVHGNLGKTKGPGYEEIGTGVFVLEEDAFDYAMKQCVEEVTEGLGKIKWTEEFKYMVVEWFYSGNWVHEDGR